MPATKRDYYEVLGVPRDADDKALKSAYRKLARECHPDVRPGDATCEERFKEISEAYSVLSDQEKRSAYDRFGHGFENYQGGPTPPPGWGSGGNGQATYAGDASMFGDLFEQLLGGGRRAAQRPERAEGRNLERSLPIRFETAIFGGSETLRLEMDEPCSACDGMGLHYVPCSACGGSGVSRGGARGIFGAAPCPSCGGRGQTPGDRCTECRGSGRVERKRRVEVKIPPGVRTGSKIRVKGEGLPGTGGAPRGDLVLSVEVAPHSFFGREDDHLTCEVGVTFSEAALGASISVPTRDGRATLKVPPGTQSGQVFRLRGMGAPRLKGGGHGDQLVTVKIVAPKKLSRKAHELLEELAKETAEDPRAGLEGVALEREKR